MFAPRFFSFVLLAAALSFSLFRQAKVIGELVQSHQENGMSLVWLDGSELRLVSFSEKRLTLLNKYGTNVNLYLAAISSDGRLLAYSTNTHHSGFGTLRVVNLEGILVKEYEQVQGVAALCWSGDGQKLAVGATIKGITGIHVINLNNHQIQYVGKGVLDGSCWSPDSNRFVYASDGFVRIFSSAEQRSTVLSRGVVPSWAPNGALIAYWESGVYYLLAPDGTNRRVFFKARGTALQWSPDSRFVAYVKRSSFIESLGSNTIEEVRLRIRRVSDGKEDWVLKFSGITPWDRFRWVTNRAFVNTAPVQKAKS